jgi:vancomycin permeability regulator SanA
VVAAAGCTDLRDLFTPYAPNPAAVRTLLAEQAPLPHYDAALVLGCPAGDDGSASLCQRCRVKSAVRQWRRGSVDAIVFSGGAAHSAVVEADVMGDLAVRRGVPAERVLRERRALTTWQNLRFSLAMLRARSAATVLVISTADHLPRARRIARYWGLDDAHARYFACDRDLPPDSDAEFAQPPTKTNG